MISQTNLYATFLLAFTATIEATSLGSSTLPLGGDPSQSDLCPENSPLLENPTNEGCGTPRTCEYGLESCCGKTSPSLSCECFPLESSWVCHYTEACSLAGCSENCPNQAPMNGDYCDSVMFDGWSSFIDEKNVCGYNRIDCSCDGLPDPQELPYEQECTCGADNKWHCEIFQCGACPTASPESVPPSSEPMPPFPPIDSCPEGDPSLMDVDVDCTVPLTCEYGSNSCCGRTTASRSCSCAPGRHWWECTAPDTCLLADCRDNCPEIAPVDGDSCDSGLFEGWSEFLEEKNVCGYNRLDCSCDGLQREPEELPFEQECACGDDNVWDCQVIQCDECTTSSPETIPTASPLQMPSLEPSTEPTIDACPEADPILSMGKVSCASPLNCQYGSESCCGRTTASHSCSCTPGRSSWECTFLDTCLAADCSENCPANVPVSGDSCDSNEFKGWSEFLEEKNVCGYNPIDCGCDEGDHPSPYEWECQCGEDNKWLCAIARGCAECSRPTGAPASGPANFAPSSRPTGFPSVSADPTMMPSLGPTTTSQFAKSSPTSGDNTTTPPLPTMISGQPTSLDDDEPINEPTAASSSSVCRSNPWLELVFAPVGVMVATLLAR